MELAKWGEYPNFSKAEFDCNHTGANEMKHEFMMKLQQLRIAFDKPMRITSGYRHHTHPIELRKGHRNGAHVSGLAADIAVMGSDAHELVRLAMQLGFNGIGVSQKAGARFIHLDVLPRKAIWSY
jgi:zinc D-Ala-D-Ala carboxypeptidase